MSLLLTFMELDKLYEDTNKQEKSGKWYFKGIATVPPDRPHAGKSVTIEDFITVTGKSEADALKNVKFKIRKDNNLPEYTKLDLYDYTIFEESELQTVDKTCPVCRKVKLSDGGHCRICGYEAENPPGEQTLIDPTILDEWVDRNGNKTSVSHTPIRQAPAQQATTGPSNSAGASNVVTIVYDSAKHKLRAQADDGVHGVGNVAFPNNLRNIAGQKYEVDSLIWNGKNYRVSGNIKPI